MLNRLIYALKPLQPNERVAYRYWKKQNGTDTLFEKQGYFVNKVRHSKKYLEIRGRVQMAVVRFDYNKVETRVPYEALDRIAQLSTPPKKEAPHE